MLRERLKSELLFFEGGMGTQLQAAGLPAGELPERWNLTNPEAVQRVHEAYLSAGCQLVKSNTFGANRPKLAEAGLSVEEVIPAALRIARAAQTATGAEAYIGLDIGPCGRLLAPFGDFPFEEAVALFAEMVEAGKELADFVLIETMSDLYEAKAAILAAKEHCDLPIIVTLTFDGSGKLLKEKTIHSTYKSRPNIYIVGPSEEELPPEEDDPWDDPWGDPWDDPWDDTDEDIWGDYNEDDSDPFDSWG